MPRARKGPRRFGAYAAMEAANVLLVPGFAFWLSRPAAPIHIAIFGIASLAVAGFLIVGALYWRGLDRRLSGRGRAALEAAVAFADRAEKPLLVLTSLASAAALGGVLRFGFAPSIIAALVLTVLAWLEYVNYYHRQLQHFDNWSDLKRLLSGKGLRPSHMARDLRIVRGG